MVLQPKIVSGLPPNVKARPRADFIPSEYDILLQTKGYRLWWSRAGICPCLNNDQTEQPDPNCTLCKGASYYYFLPDQAILQGSTVDLYGNDVSVNDDNNAVMIKGIMSGVTQDLQIYERFGEWVFGTLRITVNAENKLGYHDRLTSVDSVMSWSQVIEYEGGSEIEVVGANSKAGTRYPVVSVNQFRSLTTLYREGVDFLISADNTIQWIGTPPASGTRLSLHYHIHPVWIVMDLLHTYRDTLVSTKVASTDEADQFQKMPVQAIAKLDFLINT